MRIQTSWIERRSRGDCQPLSTITPPFSNGISADPREYGFGREDILLYDRAALGEAVVNAIAHRDYSLSGSQIRVFLFQDRIEVRSPGRLPNSVSLENIKLGVHAERNRAVATLLTQLGYMSGSARVFRG